jgi:exodeoxyribonuclease V gamma subunit
MFSVYKSNHIETLVDTLTEVIRDPPPSPFRREWISIQTQGIGTWLGLELSRQLGILANTLMPFPRALVEEIFKRVLGDRVPDTATFQRERLTWSVLSVLPELLHREEFKPLAGYLETDTTGLKHFQLSQRIAYLFDQYAVYRFDIVQKWERHPEAVDALAPDLRWQPYLWNALVERHGSVHLASAADLFLAALDKGNFDKDQLPTRISLFGISTLPPLYMHILSALSRFLPVHLFCLSPTREYWADLRSLKEIGRWEVDSTPGNEIEPHYFKSGHPLLSSMGRVGREFQSILEDTVDYDEPPGDLYIDPAGGDKVSVLTQIQSDILRLAERGSETTPAMAVPPGDASIVIHSCHGPMREVQVLHDQLLDILESDPCIDPHDVIVMAPRIDEYAPLVESVFATGEKKDVIPYSISDRSVRLEEVVVEAFLSLLSLAQSRLTLQDVLDLLTLDPVHERFGLTSEDVLSGQDWLRETGVRWGMDKAHRKAEGQPELGENTWRFGLDRLLLGYALPGNGTDLFQGTSPWDHIEGQETENLGRLMEFCQQLFSGIHQLAKEYAIPEWSALLQKLLAGLVAENTDNTYQHQSIRATLQSFAEDSGAGGFAEPVGLPVIAHLLTQMLARKPTERGFLSGGVTFCNFLPMRSIPFKVVCLLGLNDDAFPRSEPEMSFDLMQRFRRIGDRSMRNDDRYLFLEAVLSARSRLVITYTGQHIQDNGVRPPSVVVSELIDVIGEGFHICEDLPDTEPRQSLPKSAPTIVVRHPLQPFSPAYFEDAKGWLFSYSKQFHEGARALCSPKEEVPVFLAESIPMDTEQIRQVRMEDLIRFFKNPARYLLRHRLGLVFDDEVTELESREPMALAGLERHQLGEWLLDAIVGDSFPGSFYPYLRASGRLPLGRQGESTCNDLAKEIHPLAEAVNMALTQQPIPSLAVDLTVEDIRITGKIDRLQPQGRICYTYGRLQPAREIDLWITHLVLNCIARDNDPRRSKLIARGDGQPEILSLKPLGKSAGPFLCDLVNCYRQGITEPLLFFPRTSAAFARSWFKNSENPGDQAFREALKKWQPSPWHSYPAEMEDPYIHRLFGSRDPLTGENAAQRKCFEDLALLIFGPIIEAEEGE